MRRKQEAKNIPSGNSFPAGKNVKGGEYPQKSERIGPIKEKGQAERGR